MKPGFQCDGLAKNYEGMLVKQFHEGGRIIVQESILWLKARFVYPSHGNEGANGIGFAIGKRN